MPRIVLQITLLILYLSTKAQVQLTPVLVGSAGGFYNFSGGNISASSGEAAIITISNGNNILTQGFHQPIIKTSQYLEINVNSYPSTCRGSNNGALKVYVNGGLPPYKFQFEYYESNFGNTPISTIADTIDTLYNLKPGSYIVSVTDYYNREVKDTIKIGIENDGECLIKIYSGFSPNGDGVNDTWIIDGIQFYPDNSVAIYNRWGDMVWQQNGYDNNKIVWDGIWSFTGEKLPNGTYFYLINIPGQQFKGWVELTK